jgi:hypothetical protein
MKQDTELELWRNYWKTPDSDEFPVGYPAWAGQIKDRVARQSRRLWIALLAPILVTVIIGGLLIQRAVRIGHPVDYATALEGWLFIIVVWACCLGLSRGTWKPLGQSTAAFVDLAIRRSRSNLAIARLSLWLYAGQIILSAAIVWSQNKSSYSPGYFTSWPVIVIGWIGLPIFVVWLIRYRRKQAAELRRLLELRRQLSDESE